MTTDGKLIKILQDLVNKPIDGRIEPGLAEITWPPEDKVIPGYESHLHKIAITLVHKAEQGDIKAIDKIREIIGDLPWSESDDVAR